MKFSREIHPGFWRVQNDERLFQYVVYETVDLMRGKMPNPDWILYIGDQPVSFRPVTTYVDGSYYELDDEGWNYAQSLFRLVETDPECAQFFEIYLDQLRKKFKVTDCEPKVDFISKELFDYDLLERYRR